MNATLRTATLRVLVVDDKAFVREMTGRVLEGAGIKQIEYAESGKAAIALLRGVEPRIDVVFCDLMMPDMDGIEFIRHAATLPAKPAYIFVSDADEALLNTVQDTAKARGLNVLGYIQKPMSLGAVLRILARSGTAPALTGGSSDVSVSSKDLGVALTQNQFQLHFQPKTLLADGTLVGFESLARWQHPELGMVPPSVFITAAEKEGCIGPLTHHLVALALKQSAAWSSAGLHTKVSVNLSAHMLVDLDLPDRLARETARLGINPGQIILEITESGLFQDLANTLEILARLHMKGFPLSIDDFGTGYSSMEQLRRVPFSELKIDRAFVHDVAENKKARSILESSTSLARNLGLSVVAEGAETQEDWDILRNVGVDLVQGYFIAKPMPAERVQTWSTAWTSGKRQTSRPGNGGESSAAHSASAG